MYCTDILSLYSLVIENIAELIRKPATRPIATMQHEFQAKTQLCNTPSPPTVPPNNMHLGFSALLNFKKQ